MCVCAIGCFLRGRELLTLLGNKGSFMEGCLDTLFCVRSSHESNIFNDSLNLTYLFCWRAFWGHHQDNCEREDKADGYTCKCKNGFNIQTLEDGEVFCMPVSCGTPPSVLNAQDSGVGKAVYPHTISYNCLPGFSLDGHRNGETSFDISCLSSGTFTPVDECQNVTCGAPPKV